MLIVQAERSECGLACLAMVASHYGNRLGLSDLRRRFPLSLKGANLSQLIDIAHRLGFRSRALRLELQDLPRLSLPCILHWDLNHFVVLVRTSEHEAVIHDPAGGIRKLPHAEISRHFTGIALELTPTSEFEQCPAAPSITLRQLTGHVRGLGRSLALVLLLSAVLQVFVILAPFFLQWVVDQVMVSADRDLLVILGLGFGFALVLQVGVGLLRGWSVVYLSNRLGLQWMSNVFVHLLKLPLDFFEKRHLGDVTSRLDSIKTIQRTLTTSFVEAVIDGMMALVTFTLMLAYSPKLALVTVVAVAIYFGTRMALLRHLRDSTEQQLMCAARQDTHLFESLRGLQSIKVAAREGLRTADYHNLMVDTLNRDFHLAKLGLGFSSVNQLVFGIERIVVIWIGALLALENVFSVGMLIAYLAYKDLFASRVAALVDKCVDFRMLRLHGERLADIVLSPPEAISQLPSVTDMGEDMTLEVRDLGYRYADGEPWILQGCNLRVEQGESVAIVGPSGCGKTTLVKLLLGLLSPSHGNIVVGGQDLARMDTHQYRSRVGAVMQDDQLFAGSIADNIAFFHPELDQVRIETAARMAAIHDEIIAMPMGYQSLIGDMGTALSGGQKQRVILARALYREPTVLFLDEATSHLDVDCERLVNNAVRKLKLTKVIVAHRPETISSADRVLVMAEGSIVREFRPHTAATVTDAAVEA